MRAAVEWTYTTQENSRSISIINYLGQRRVGGLDFQTENTQELNKKEVVLKKLTNIGDSEVTLFSVLPWHSSSSIYIRKSVIKFCSFTSEESF